MRSGGGGGGGGLWKEQRKEAYGLDFVWEVKDRNGVYILYRGEFAMSQGVIISTKQTRCFDRD